MASLFGFAGSLAEEPEAGHDSSRMSDIFGVIIFRGM